MYFLIATNRHIRIITERSRDSEDWRHQNSLCYLIDWVIFFCPYFNFLCQPVSIFHLSWECFVTDITKYASSIAVRFLKLGWIAFIANINHKARKPHSRPPLSRDLVCSRVQKTAFIAPHSNIQGSGVETSLETTPDSCERTGLIKYCCACAAELRERCWSEDVTFNLTSSQTITGIFKLLTKDN